MVSKFSLDVNDYEDIDSRMKPFLRGWKVTQNYKGKKVTIPDTWDSDIFPVKYFQIIKKSGDPNYPGDESEDEIGLTMWAGWKEDDNSGCYDHEVEINLFILGRDVKDKTLYKVGAEVFKTGGAEMVLYYNNKKVTDFTQIKDGGWWRKKIKTSLDKIWVSDMKRYQ